MDQHRFISWIQQPGQLADKDSAGLKAVTEEYPYCQSAQILYFLSLLKSRNIHFHGRLKLAAAYAADRALLKDHVDLLLDPESQAIKAEQHEKVEPVQEPEPDETHNAAHPNEEADEYDLPQKDVETPVTAEEENIEAFGEEDFREDLPKADEEEISETAESATTGQKLQETDQPAAQDSGEKSPEGEAEKDVAGPSKASARKSKKELIDQFIENAPRISRSRSDFYNPVDYAKSSAVDKDDIVSETLANIHYRQGHYQKAIKIYKKLSLKYPEKSTYFAGLIEKIKSEQNLNT